MGRKKGKKDQTGSSVHSRSNNNLNTTIEAEATYYNVQTPSRASQSIHSHEGQSQGQGQHAGRPVPPSGHGPATVDSSSSSSSSSSTTSSDSDSVEGQLAMVPRPPNFNPYMMGGAMNPGGVGNPYGIQSGGYGGGMGGPQGGPPGLMGGPLMLPSSAGGMMGHGGPGGGGQMVPAGGGGYGGVSGPPARYLPQDEPSMEERLQHLNQMAKTPHPLVMEHPSLRQCVIFMAIMFLLALVALVVTSIYFGRTTETSWNI